CRRGDAPMSGRRQVDGPRRGPQRRGRSTARRLPRKWVRTGGGWGRRGRTGRGGSWRSRSGSPRDLDRGLAAACAYAGLDDGHAVGDPRDRAAVIDLRDVDVVGRPDDADGGDDIPDAIERRGEQTTAFPDADGHRWRGDLDFGDVLRRRCAPHRSAKEKIRCLSRWM